MEGASVKTVVTYRKWQIFALNFQRCIILVTRSVYCAFKAVLQDQE
jgi:predicted proteasome-type protease